MFECPRAGTPVKPHERMVRPAWRQARLVALINLLLDGGPPFAACGPLARKLSPAA